MNISDYKRELELTINNTSELYEQARNIKDFDWLGDEIEELYMNTWVTISENYGKNVAPTLYTDHDVKDVMDKIISIASGTQR